MNPSYVCIYSRYVHHHTNLLLFSFPFIISDVYHDTPSIEEAEAGDSEVDPSITQAEITGVVWKLLSGKAPGLD